MVPISAAPECRRESGQAKLGHVILVIASVPRTDSQATGFMVAVVACQRQCCRKTFCRLFVAASWKEFRKKARQDQPQAWQIAAPEKHGGGQKSFRCRAGPTADAEVATVKLQGLADGAGNGVQRNVRHEM